MLVALGCKVSIVQIPTGKAEGWDAADCIAEGGDAAALIAGAVEVNNDRIQTLQIQTLQTRLRGRGGRFKAMISMH